MATKQTQTKSNAGATQNSGNNKPAAKKEIPAIFVQSRGNRFYRAGHKFTRHGHGIALDALTKDQLKAIQEEPQLIVEECTIDAADVQETEGE